MVPMIQVPARLWKLPVLAMVALLAGDLLATQLVRASSEEAWDALVKEASAACQIASELENPRVLWSSPAYERAAALIVTGKWPQTHMKGEQGYMLCLFDKQSSKVEIQEIEPTLFR
ncbi:MAG TPA: hypothetical protein VGQ35_12920 [Dongiaceae bacterium]|jgi:hypothetical protein|nr:hypothetical protein [Dongiaceae bacterium]